MLAHHQPQRRQLVDLAPLAQDDRCICCQRRLAVRAHRRSLLHHLVGRRHQPQRLAPMADLPARLPAALLAQTLGLARLSPQSVAGGWLAAVVTVLGQPRLQFLHARHERRDLVSLARVLGFELRDACVWRHASMLRLLCKSA